MADITAFDMQSAKRIANAVQRVEKLPKDRHARNANYYRGVIPPPRLGQINGDVSYNDTVTVRLLEGAVASEAVPGSYDEVDAHNLLYRKLWADSFVLCQWAVVKGSSRSKYRIVWSDSASRLRGIANTGSGIAAGDSGNVDTLVQIDGKFSESSITAYNVLDNFDVEEDTTVFCEWCQGNEQWEIYAADCAPA